MKDRILIVGDTHMPWVCHKTLDKIYRLTQYLNPTIIVQIGDLYDAFSFSRYPKSPNLMTPAQEIEKGYSEASKFWQRIRKTCPKAKCFQLIGNHDERPKKILMSLAPELETLMSFMNLFEFDGVEVSNSERDELIIGDILFQHGYRKLGDHVRHNLINTVCGHSHHGGVVYMRHGRKTLWELNAGFCGLESSPVMSYTKQKRISTYTLGCGYVDHLGPRFISL